MSAEAAATDDAPVGPARFAHDATYRVRFDEAGPDGLLRTSALMRYAQDLAWLHSTALGFGREWYAERGLTWLVRAADVEVLADVPMGTTLAARTEVVAIRRVFARRRGTFRLPDGRTAAVVNTDWVLIDARGALTRVPAVFGEMFGSAGGGSAGTVSVGRVPLSAAPSTAPSVELEVRRQELDPMGHANNAVYLDWLEEAILAADPTDGARAIAAVPRRYRLEYAAAAAPATRIRATAWVDGTWRVRLADRATGADLFRVVMEPGAAGPDAMSE